MSRIFHGIVTYHWSTTLLLMGLFSALGALASYNIFVQLAANFRFLGEHGVMAIMEGALVQLGGLLVSGYFALAMYLGFKACEHVLMDRIFGK